MMRPGRRAGVHDPERDAALYVQGEMRARDRVRFEAHLLGCERCWNEVRQGRRGRLLAERGRELSPPGLREEVRAALSLSAGPVRRHSGLLGPVSVVVVLGLVGAGLFVAAGLRGRPEQPGPIAAALASFRSQEPTPALPTVHDPPDLRAAGLVLVHSGRTSLAGLPVDVFWFARGGTKVVLFLGSRRFPRAVGAHDRTGSVHGWEAVDGGVRLLCADSPLSYLLMSDDPSLARRAEGALREQAIRPAP